MKFRRFAAFLALSAPLVACVSGSDSTTPSPNPNAGFQARFVPLGGEVPFPNDLFFNGSTTGQLNIPGSTLVAQNGPLLELNHLDGFGTQSDISIYFTQPVDKTTLTPANIIVLKVTSDAGTKAVTGFSKALIPGTDYTVELSPGIDSNDQIVTIKPLHPLDPSTVDATTGTATPSTYLVIVTRGVKDSSGANVSPSADFSTIVTADTPAVAAGGNPAKIAMAKTDPLFPVAEFSLGQLAVASAVVTGLKPADIAVTFSFSTQYLNVSLASLALTAAATTQPTGTGIIDTGETVCQILVASKQLPNAAACAAVPGSTLTEVFAGSIALPYYLTVPATGSTAALTDSWHNAKGGDTGISITGDPTSFTPKATVTQNVIPVLVAIPLPAACTMPGGGWPTIIFQHGITRSREDMLGIASTLAVGGLSVTGTFCAAVIAMDLPLHGVTDTTDPFYQNQLFKGTAAAAILTRAVQERTFNMSATGAAGATGANIGTSGAQFINLTSTITSRDNLREGAADLINLVATLPNLTAITPPATVNIFDSSQVFYVGHSLGGIIGTTFLGADTASGSPKIVAASLANPGGHIAELLRTSPEFEPIIDAGLAQQGLVKGSQSYYDFYSEAQAVVEDGDPANYAGLAVAGHPIHMLEVVGGGNFGTGSGASCNLSDQVVPNSATELLVSEMGLTTTTLTAGTSTTPVPGGTPIVRFLAGDHGSVLSPALPSNCASNSTNTLIYEAVTGEMQSEIISFLALSGTAVVVNNSAGIVK